MDPTLLEAGWRPLMVQLQEAPAPTLVLNPKSQVNPVRLDEPAMPVLELHLKLLLSQQVNQLRKQHQLPDILHVRAQLHEQLMVSRMWICLRLSTTLMAW